MCQRGKVSLSERQLITHHIHAGKSYHQIGKIVNTTVQTILNRLLYGNRIKGKVEVLKFSLMIMMNGRYREKFAEIVYISTKTYTQKCQSTDNTKCIKEAQNSWRSSTKKAMDQ